MNNLASLYRRMGRLEESAPLYVRALEGRRRVHGETHRWTLGTMEGLALVYQLQGRYADAEALVHLREAIERGWAGWSIAGDSDLASLRGDSEFEALATRV